MIDSRALSVAQVADSLGIRRHGVLALIHSGELLAVDVSLTPGGRPRWRVLSEELERFVLRRTFRKTPPRRRRSRTPQMIKQYF